MNETSLNLYDYSDYRLFLRDHFEKVKEENELWSYGAWAKKIDLGSNTSIIKVINGQRDLGREIREKLENYFEFDEKQKEYFSLLVNLSKSKERPAVKMALSENIRQRSRYFNVFKKVDNSQLTSVLHWWNFAIRKMFCLKKKFKTAEELSQGLRSKLPAKNITQALKILVEKKMIEKEGDFYKVCGDPVTTEDDISCESIKKFHTEILAEATKSLREDTLDEREISGVTLNIKKEDFESAQASIRHFQDSFFSAYAASPGSGDEVYQMHVCFFPLTKIGASK